MEMFCNLEASAVWRTSHKTSLGDLIPWTLILNSAPFYCSSRSHVRVHATLLTARVADWLKNWVRSAEFRFWWITKLILLSFFISVWSYGKLLCCYMMDVGAPLRSPSIILAPLFFGYFPDSLLCSTQRARSGWESMVPGRGFSYSVFCDWCVRVMESPAPLPEVGAVLRHTFSPGFLVWAGEAPLCRTLRAQLWLASSGSTSLLIPCTQIFVSGSAAGDLAYDT